MDRNEAKGIIILIDDAESEQDIFKHALKKLKLKNRLKYFSDAESAYSFLKGYTGDVFLIVCDLHMPKLDGLDFKRMVDSTPEISIRSIPLFMHSSTSTSSEVKAAYANGIQGFIKKSDNIDDTICALQRIVDLWTVCVHPNELKGKYVSSKKCESGER